MINASEARIQCVNKFLDIEKTSIPVINGKILEAIKQGRNEVQHIERSCPEIKRDILRKYLEKHGYKVRVYINHKDDERPHFTISW